MAPSSDEHENYVVHLKGISEKVENRIKSDPLTVTQFMFELCNPGTNSAPASECDRKTKDMQTPYFRTYSRCVVRSLQTLHGGRARRAHHKRCQPFFSIQFIVFPLGGKMLIFGY